MQTASAHMSAWMKYRTGAEQGCKTDAWDWCMVDFTGYWSVGSVPYTNLQVFCLFEWFYDGNLYAFQTKFHKWHKLEGLYTTMKPV